MICASRSTIKASRLLQVAHVTLQLDTGGMEKLVLEFARHADRSRFGLRFVSLTGRGAIAEDIEALGWPVTALEDSGGVRPSLVLRLARLMREWAVDVVHVHNTKPLLYCAPAARLAGVTRVVYTRHGQRHRATGRQNALFRMTTRLVDDVVCVSEDGGRRSIVEGIAPNRVCTVWNGVDVGRFAYAGPTGGGPAVMVGRLSPEKDVATLLAATKMVVDQEPGFRLEIAGDGKCLAELGAQCTGLGLDEQVRFHGNVEDVAGLLGRASMCVLPSLTEGISLTLLESMARGLPVVATRVGGNPEVVEEGQTGILVRAQAPAELAEAMLKLYRDPALGRAMGCRGRKRVETHFDIRRMVAKYEEIYSGLRTRGTNGSGSNGSR
jgi:glycosyltransferase involved in cell wall biosynthesis